MINNSYRTNTGVDRNNRLWNGSTKGGANWFEPSKYGLNQNYSSPNNVSLFPEDDKKIGLNSESASKIDTKNSSISPGRASEIRKTLLSMPQNEKTQDYLSSLNDDELEQNYKLAEESLNIGLLQGRYLPLILRIFPPPLHRCLFTTEATHKPKSIFRILHTANPTKMKKKLFPKR